MSLRIIGRFCMVKVEIIKCFIGGEVRGRRKEFGGVVCKT